MGVDNFTAFARFLVTDTYQYSISHDSSTSYPRSLPYISPDLFIGLYKISSFIFNNFRLAHYIQLLTPTTTTTNFLYNRISEL